jgi:hypothetical protein
MLKALVVVCAGEEESETCTVKENVPDCEGRPEI